MKRPEKVIKWFPVERKRDEPFVDHNGKPLFEYVIILPYWIAKAYNPHFVKVEISRKFVSFADMQKEENNEETDRYLKQNWSRKLTKLRKLNNNFMLVSLKTQATTCFKSMEDYENYHRELQELNRKYCGLTEGCVEKNG